MRKALILFTTVAAFLPSIDKAQAQGAWCEANCKALCAKIYGRAGAAECYARIPCANYAGKSCAPASVVNARYVTFCHANRGKGTCR